MALTPDTIKAQAVLATLTEDQVSAISTLSVNDEKAVIGTRIGELHGGYDTDIFNASGIPKNQGEKSYEYAKRVIGEFKGKATKSDELSGQISTLGEKIKEYETQIKEGKGSEIITKKLQDAEQKVSALQTQFETEKQNWDKEKTEFSTQIQTVKLNTEFEKATAGLKFKAGFTEPVQEMLIRTARETVLSKYKTDWVDNGKGGLKLVFRDSNNTIMLNQENKLEPFTVTELISVELKDTLDFGKVQPGTGTGPDGKPIIKTSIDLSDAKSQVQADDLIASYLLKMGKIRGTEEFVKEQTRIRKEFKVEALPFQ